MADPSDEQALASTDGAGAFSYASAAESPEESTPINPIRLRPIEHINFPLWDAEDHLGDDFESLHEALGLSRDTYDDLARWQAEFDRLRALPADVTTEHAWHAHARWGSELRDQLAGELSPKYSVEFDDNYR